MFLLLSLLLSPIALASDWNNQYCSENEEDLDALCLIQSRTNIAKSSLAAWEANLHIIPPASEKYNLSTHSLKNPYASEWGQDRLVEPFFKGKKDGFFVESGALDGEGASNTLFFEMHHGWNGLLVEPNPTAFDHIQKKRRKAFSYNGCLSNSRRVENTTFFFEGHFGLDHQGGNTMYHTNEQAYNVTCAPLQNLLGSLHRQTVDLWSLDIEGSEPGVLENTDFQKVEVGVLIIEWNQPGAMSKQSDYERMQAVLDREGFQYVGSSYYSGGFGDKVTPCDQWVQLDRVFVNPKYFEARDLKVPTQLPENPLCPGIL